jgi:hypothetical protein
MTAAGHHNSRKNVRRDQVSQEGPALATFLFDGERSVWQKDIFFITDFDSGNIAQLFSDLPWREERTATTRFYRLPNHSPAQDRPPAQARGTHLCSPPTSTNESSYYRESGGKADNPVRRAPRRNQQAQTSNPAIARLDVSI